MHSAQVELRGEIWCHHTGHAGTLILVGNPQECGTEAQMQLTLYGDSGLLSPKALERAFSVMLAKNKELYFRGIEGGVVKLSAPLEKPLTHQTARVLLRKLARKHITRILVRAHNLHRALGKEPVISGPTPSDFFVPRKKK